MAISLQDLIERFHLSGDLLDASLSDEHLRDVSRIIADQKILGSELGLTSADMTTINQQPPEHQRLAMLEKWKQKFDWTATYRKIIDALLKCTRADLARQVCELLAPRKCKHRAIDVGMQSQHCSHYNWWFQVLPLSRLVLVLNKPCCVYQCWWYHNVVKILLLLHLTMLCHTSMCVMNVKICNSRLQQCGWGCKNATSCRL